MCKYGGRGPGGARRGLRGRVAPFAGLNVPLFSCSDPDNVAFCVLAADGEDEGDIALQIHFTLIQAFCCENDIDIVRVNDVAKLAAIVGPSEESGEPRDLHCILITVGVLCRSGLWLPGLCFCCWPLCMGQSEPFTVDPSSTGGQVLFWAKRGGLACAVQPVS